MSGLFAWWVYGGDQPALPPRRRRRQPPPPPRPVPRPEPVDETHVRRVLAALLDLR